MSLNYVIGAGFSGATIANLIATELNEKVIVIDKRNHLAGNCYDYFENGICIHKYGSHIFHTQSEKVWNYINKFTRFNNYQHKVIAVIDGKETNIPFNLNSIYDVFPQDKAKQLEEKLLKNFKENEKIPILEFLKIDDEDLKNLAEFIYEKVFLHYTQKQWGLKPNEIDSLVTARVPVFISRDNRYFQDQYQGIPLEGYTKVIDKMLFHPNIEIRLNTEFKNIDGDYERIFYSGSIDEFFDCKFGLLPYRSVKFKMEKHEKEFYQSNSVINYPCDYDFTRIHEYKHYLKQKSDFTIIAKEFPEDFQIGKNVRTHPILNEKSRELYGKYFEEAKRLDNIYFFGRLGNFQYYDIDQAILRAMNLFEKIVQK